jgi:hypothetical protein
LLKKPVLDLKRQDIQDYIEFCLDPPTSWIGLKRVARFIERGGIRQPNPRWRPFVATVTKQEHKQGKKPKKSKYCLSQKSLREIFTVLSSFYHFLLLEEKVPASPIALIRQKSRYIQKRQTRATVKRLIETQWQYCLKTAKQLVFHEPDRHERTLFIISALYLLYLRISELAANERWIPQMKHFYQDSHQNWWFKTFGAQSLQLQLMLTACNFSCLRLTYCITTICPRLDTKYAGSAFSRQHLQLLTEWRFLDAPQTIFHI